MFVLSNFGERVAAEDGDQPSIEVEEDSIHALAELGRVGRLAGRRQARDQVERGHGYLDAVPGNNPSTFTMRGPLSSQTL
jgi:hypothetical protein